MNPYIEISGRRIGKGYPTYIIAEMSANHGHDFNKALKIEPENMDFLYVLFDFYFKRSKFNEAKNIVDTMVKIAPDLPEVKELLDLVKERIRQIY